MYQINWLRKALKQLSKIDRIQQIKIIDAVDGLQDFPNTQNVIPLIKNNYDYRLRIGKYRVLFNADTNIKIIDIQQVKKRDENTY